MKEGKTGKKFCSSTGRHNFYDLTLHWYVVKAVVQVLEFSLNISIDEEGKGWKIDIKFFSQTSVIFLVVPHHLIVSGVLFSKSS